MGLGALLLLAALGLGLIMLVSSIYFQWLFRRMVLTRLRDLDTVRATGLAPPGWQKRYLKRIEQNHYTPALWQRQLKKNLKNLARLEKFVRKTRLVESEETRAGVLMELSAIRQGWEALQPGDAL